MNYEGALYRDVWGSIGDLSFILADYLVSVFILFSMKNLEEIQDQIAICAKREIKVQKRNKSLKKGIKVLIEKGK